MEQKAEEKETALNLCLRKSIFYPAAEIYANSPSGFYDFGPVGERIRRKVVGEWRRRMVESEGMLEILGAQILPEEVFRASGHLENFSDPIVQCVKCHSIYRADKLIEEKTGHAFPEATGEKQMKAELEKLKIVCPKCKGALGEVRKFNMMMKVDVGATGNQPCYLRPETCQSIFLDFSRIYKTMRVSLPVGVAQAGASFRNEISPRNALLRVREIGQMEIEVFFDADKINEVARFEEVADYNVSVLRIGKEKPELVAAKELAEKKIVSGKLVAYYLARAQQFYEGLGFAVEKMRFRELEKEARAFYAKETWDFEVLTEQGWIELSANNYRTDYDLKGHSKQSKQDLGVNENGKKILPHVYEISTGIDRSVYAIIDNSLREEEK
ncbi:MAG: glycine--tRNA ligase, partial [archaeon]